jgi:putative sigma-54 modulation protein
MNLSITGHHLEVTPALREYITAKLDRIKRHFDQVVDISVLLSVEKLQQRAEVTVHVRGKDLFAESVHEDLYAAVDTLIDKLDRQVLKYKETRQGHAHESPKRHEAG